MRRQRWAWESPPLVYLHPKLTQCGLPQYTYTKTRGESITRLSPSTTKRGDQPFLSFKLSVLRGLLKRPVVVFSTRSNSRAPFGYQSLYSPDPYHLPCRRFPKQLLQLVADAMAKLQLIASEWEGKYRDAYLQRKVSKYSCIPILFLSCNNWWSNYSILILGRVHRHYWLT